MSFTLLTVIVTFAVLVLLAPLPSVMVYVKLTGAEAMMEFLANSFHSGALAMHHGHMPEITFTGTVDDWRSVRRRAQTLAEYGAKATHVSCKLRAEVGTKIAALECKPPIDARTSFVEAKMCTE